MNKHNILIGGLVFALVLSSYLITASFSNSHPPEPLTPVTAAVPEVTPVASLVHREELEIPIQPHVALPDDDAKWWDDPETIKYMTDRFAAQFEEYRTGSILDCERGEYGDQCIKVTKKNWRWFHRDLEPSLEMFEGSNQFEKWVLAGMIQKVSDTTELRGDVYRRKLTPSAELEFQNRLRNEALYFAPELILHEEFGSDWSRQPGLADEVRALWIAMIRLASPVQAELDLRQRCAMYVFGDIKTSQVHLIAPSIREYEVMMEGFHHEFFDGIVAIIQDVQD